MAAFTYGPFTIRMKDGVTTASHASIATFKFNIQKSIEQAAQLTIETSTASAVPAWYDKENKRVYAANASGHYWAVDDNKLTYT